MIGLYCRPYRQEEYVHALGDEQNSELTLHPCQLHCPEHMLYILVHNNNDMALMTIVARILTI